MVDIEKNISPIKNAREKYDQLLPVALLCLLLVASIALIYTANAFYNRIETERAADTDNFSWSVNQLEVEMYAVSLAIEQQVINHLTPSARKDPLEDNDLNLWMDIFYSRVDAVSATITGRTQDPQLHALLPELQQKTEELYDLIAIFDGSDSEDVYTARVRASELQTLSRKLSLSALQSFLNELNATKTIEEQLFRKFFVITLSLLGGVFITALFVLILWARFSSQTKRMRLALDSESRVFMSVPVGIAITDEFGEIRFVNPSFSVMFGCDSETCLGKNIQSIFESTPGGFEGLVAGEKRSSLSESFPPNNTKITACRKDGSTFFAEISFTKNFDIDGNPIFVIMLHDVTLNLIAMDEIRAARDEAEKNAVTKSNFLATMSHEMRTPLHCAIAALDLIEQEKLDEDQLKLIEIAKLTSERAIEEVNTVLDVSRDENTEPRLSDFSPRKIVEGILCELQPLAGQGGNHIDMICDGPGADLSYRGNVRAFGRAIYNLVSNAVKFTDHGNIEVSLTFSEHGDNHNKLDVKVRDEGIGVAPEDEERIFQEFVMLETEELGRETSIGLGLPIARRSVASMGGTLDVESKVGVGSVFSFSILLQQSFDEELTKEPGKVVSTSFGQDLNFLVVDDKELNRELLSKMVSQLGHNHASAANGLEAVSSACHSAYDVILMDDSMPVMGGREAVRHIRAGGPSKHSLIIGVTAYSDEERLRDFDDAGADLVLIKPVKKQQLVEALEYLNIRNRNLSEIASHEDAFDQDAFDQKESVGAFDRLKDALGSPNAYRLLDETLVDIKKQSEYLLDDLSSLESIADRMHGVVGTTSFTGLDELSKLLRAAEESARAGKRSELRNHYDQISTCLNQELIAVKFLSQDVKNIIADNTMQVAGVETD